MHSRVRFFRFMNDFMGTKRVGWLPTPEMRSRDEFYAIAGGFFKPEFR